MKKHFFTNEQNYYQLQTLKTLTNFTNIRSLGKFIYNTHFLLKGVLVLLVLILNQYVVKSVPQENTLTFSNRGEVELKKAGVAVTVRVEQQLSPNGKYNLDECKKNGFSCQPAEGNKGIIVSLIEDIYTFTDLKKEIPITFTEDMPTENVADNTPLKGRIIVTIPKNIKASLDNSFVVIEGESKSIEEIRNAIKITGIDGSPTLTPVPFTIEAGAEPNTLTIINEIARAGAKGETKLTVKTKLNDESKISATQISITVTEAIETISISGGSQIVYSGETVALDLYANGESTKKISPNRISCTSDTKDLPVTLQVKNGQYILTASRISGKESMRGKVTCRLLSPQGNEKNRNNSVTFDVEVKPKEGYFEIESFNGNLLFPNKSLTFFIKVFDIKGKPVEAGIRYELDDEEKKHKDWVKLSASGQRLTVNWVNSTDPKAALKPPATVTIKINATFQADGGNGEIFSTLVIRLVSVGKFAPLKVKINVMDDSTVSDLYGDVTSDEYHVLMVRLFNDLKKEDAEGDGGESILAYSSSIEIAVGLEKQFHSDSSSQFSGGRLDESDYYEKEKNNTDNKRSRENKRKLRKVFQEMANETASENIDLLASHLGEVRKRYNELLGELRNLMNEASKKEAEAIRLEAIAKIDEDQARDAKKARVEAEQAFELVKAKNREIRRLVRSAVPPMPTVSLPNNLAIKDGKWYPATRDDLVEADEQSFTLRDEEVDSPVSIKDNEPNCIDTITYRPLTFEMMVNTVDRRDGRTFRSRAFRILNLVGTTASAITAVAVPSPRSDISLGLEKYGNVLVPGLEKIFPSLIEQHRQNIVSQAMKPIEEIAFGEDINRVLFIPKKDIRGLIRGHNARISTICPFYFKIKVAVVTKGGEVVLDGQ